MSYLILNTRSAFSFLYGSYHPEALVAAATEMAAGGVVLADWHGLYGMVRLARAGKAAGLHTLCGSAVAIGEGGALLLLPRDKHGHAALASLLSRAHLENPRGHPRIWLRWLAGASGLVGLVPGRLVLGLGPQWLKRVQRIFSGPMLMGLPGAEVSDAQRDYLRALAGSLSMDAVAAPEVVAIDERGYDAHCALTAIARTIHHRDVRPLPPGSGMLLRARQLTAWFSAAEIKATWQVMDLCSFELALGRRWLPDYPAPKGESVERVLSRRCLRLLARRKGKVETNYLRRLERELAAINSFGFAPYFLLVADLVAFARSRGIRATVRGSAAGSMVTWLLCGGVDPVAHDLLFERFLNDGRNEPPDVDIDFDSLRRDEVFRYLMERFEGAAAMVATVPTFRARSAIRELCLAMGGDRDKASALTDFIPYYTAASALPEVLAGAPELSEHPLNHEKRLLELAGAISGLPRQLSVHLGGVALGPLRELVPIELSAQNLPVIQLDKDDTEDLGLIKLDLLGLRMHTAQASSLELLAARGVEVEPDRLPLDDEAVYDFLCTTDTVGVFQVESPGQRGLLGRLQPRDFHDLMVEISLFRPGPMQADMVTPYIERRAGRQPLAFPHPILEPILGETMGVVVFQEQILRIAHHLAGMSYGQADGLRRAMTHKRSPAEMNKMRQGFIDGCAARGVEEGAAAVLWEQVASFASYGFCKAHAASFAHITYQSAWLRVHHPLEFFLGLLNAGHVGGYPRRTLVNEARRQGIAILGPHVNKSGVWFRSEDGAIRVGLVTIRGIGSKGAERLVAARERHGPFRDQEDLTSRSGLTKSQIKVLKDVGAVDLGRRQLGLFDSLPLNSLPPRRSAPR